MRWLAALVAVALVAVALAACSGEVPRRDGTAGVDPAYAAAPEGDARAEAIAALERDAWRREERFLEAIEPGRALARTAVPGPEIAAGLWSAGELDAIGRALFDHAFTPAEGLGGEGSIARVLGGGRPDARRCTACHGRRGSGADVAYVEGDGDSIASALARTPPALEGAAVLEIVARRMTEELHALRDAAIATARSRGARARVELVAGGVGFGTLAADPDGTVDASGVLGIDADLVVRPFGWKGRASTVREVVDRELAIHLGLEGAELGEGQRVALTVAVGLRPIPIVEVPASADLAIAHARGERMFGSLGCASCHVPSIPLDDAIWEPAPGLAIDLMREGGGPRPGGGAVWIYSDLRRHDLGPGLADARDEGAIAASTFRTPPLWGVAESAPYLHDGRAPSIEDAILAHGGEAQGARDAYAALAEADRAPLRVFLAGLTRTRRLEVP